MYQEERILKILEYLKEHNSMSVHEICEMLDVSRDTARRDILKLIEQGAAVRTHGGISLPIFKSAIEAYRERLESFSQEKKFIAERALNFIEENKHYFFDVSTTVRFLAENINKSITVFTHSLDNIEILSEKDDVFVHSTGGCLNKRNRFFFKPGCINYLEGIKFDVAFLGAAAITTDGLYYEDEEDSFIKNSVINQSHRVILLADHQKFHQSSYYRGAKWKDIDIVITDKTPPAIYLEIFAEREIEVIII